MIRHFAEASGSWRLAGLLILVAMQWTAAWAATPINKCTIISEPGDYILTQDLVCPNNNGILIIASHVTLNLDHHDIVGSGDVGIGIQVGYPGSFPSEVTILGPSTISNFSGGVVFMGVENSTVKGVTVTRNSQGFGIQSLQGRVSRSNTFENNIASFNQAQGFAISDAEQNTFRGNTTHRNNNGIVLYSNSRGNRLEDNVATENFSVGIDAYPDARDNVIRHNTARDNTAYDLVDENSGCANTWEDNTFRTSKGPCIH